MYTESSDDTEDDDIQPDPKFSNKEVEENNDSEGSQFPFISGDSDVLEKENEPTSSMSFGRCTLLKLSLVSLYFC